MSKIRFVGVDVHAGTIAVAVAEPDGEARPMGIIPNRLESIRKLVHKLGPASELRACYEAGPTGYVLYWQLTALGVASFLVLDPDFPRSIRFTLHTALARLSRIRPAGAVGRPGAESLERLRLLEAWVSQQRAPALGAGSALHDLLTRVVDDTAVICDAIGRELLGQAPGAPPPSAAQ